MDTHLPLSPFQPAFALKHNEDTQIPQINVNLSETQRGTGSLKLYIQSDIWEKMKSRVCAKWIQH